MGEFFGSIWWFVITLGILITFHEFGHFYVARRLGVRVLRFAVGFGTPLWRRVGRDGTEYVIGAIPLGGYVKMQDEREGPVAAELASASFNRQPVWSRFAIVAAGPVANLVFAVFAFWLMFVIGKPDIPPVIAAPTGIAERAGLAEGDTLVAIDGRDVRSWSDAALALMSAAVARQDVAVRFTQADGDAGAATLTLSELPAGIDERARFGEIGLAPRPLPAVIGRVEPGLPAAEAGLLPGDRVVAINAVAVAHFGALQRAIQTAAAENAALEITYVRDGTERALSVSARADQIDGKTVYRIGIAPAPGEPYFLRYGPLAALPAALGELGSMTSTTLGFLGRMVIGDASLDNIAGPVGIAQTANASAGLGVAWFLSFLALMSLSIAILNLLPIPILDGGHLLYYLIEMVKGSPVSERVMVAGQYVGIVMLTGLMGVAFYNDIARLID